jgi:hypothetical protein
VTFFAQALQVTMPEQVWVTFVRLDVVNICGWFNFASAEAMPTQWLSVDLSQSFSAPAFVVV